jgi:hypothetical protein
LVPVVVHGEDRKGKTKPHDDNDDNDDNDNNDIAFLQKGYKPKIRFQIQKVQHFEWIEAIPFISSCVYFLLGLNSIRIKAIMCYAARLSPVRNELDAKIWIDGNQMLALYELK